MNAIIPAPLLQCGSKSRLDAVQVIDTLASTVLRVSTGESADMFGRVREMAARLYVAYTTAQGSETRCADCREVAGQQGAPFANAADMWSWLLCTPARRPQCHRCGAQLAKLALALCIATSRPYLKPVDARWTHGPAAWRRAFALTMHALTSAAPLSSAARESVLLEATVRLLWTGTTEANTLYLDCHYLCTIALVRCKARTNHPARRACRILAALRRAMHTCTRVPVLHAILQEMCALVALVLLVRPLAFQPPAFTAHLAAALRSQRPLLLRDVLAPHPGSAAVPAYERTELKNLLLLLSVSMQ